MTPDEYFAQFGGNSKQDASSQDLSTPEGYMSVFGGSSSTPTNQSNDPESYITQRSQKLGLDPKAVLGVASNEGMSGGVGDNGTSFGPFQLHAGGALPPEIWNRGADYAQKWAWSPEGIDYALGKMADSGARGKQGLEAVKAIVYNFERPADPTADLNAGFKAVGGMP